MCRWFVYISQQEDCLLDDVILTPDHGLAKQVSERFLPGLVPHGPDGSISPHDREEINLRNTLFNIDGFGLAWYTSAKSDFTKGCDGLRPAMYKGIIPPLNDINFKSLCENSCTKTLFAHVRAASGGTSISPANNHPFVFGRHSFMHNGTVINFASIRREICNMLGKDEYENIHGSTDSEHLAALYMHILTKGRGKEAWEEEYETTDMANALQEAVITFIKTQQKILGKDTRPSSLNLAVTDGERFVTFRFRNHKNQQAPSLYYSTTAGQTLNRKYPDTASGAVNTLATKSAEDHPKHLIVASEPTTHKESEWHLIDTNSKLLFEKDGSWKIEKIDYDASFNVEDPEHEIVHGQSKPWYRPW